MAPPLVAPPTELSLGSVASHVCDLRRTGHCCVPVYFRCAANTSTAWPLLGNVCRYSRARITTGYFDGCRDQSAVLLVCLTCCACSSYVFCCCTAVPVYGGRVNIDETCLIYILLWCSTKSPVLARIVPRSGICRGKGRYFSGEVCVRYLSGEVCVVD